MRTIIAVICLWSGLANAQFIPFPGPGALASVSGGGTSALVAVTCKGSAAGGAVTTDPINTTDGNLIVIALADQTTPGSTVADNKSNGAPTALTRHGNVDYGHQFFYYFAPTVGSGHTFTATPTSGSSYPSLCVIVFSGANSSPVDVGNGATQGSATSSATGSTGALATSSDICVAGMTWGDNSNTIAADSGFSVAAQVDLGAFQHFGNAIAYKVKTNTTAENVTFSWTTPSSSHNSIMCFKAGGGATPPANVIEYIAGICGGSSNGNTFTTSSFNSTGANFIALGISYDQPHTFPVISDSKGNTYTCNTVHELAGSFGSAICFKENATVGTGHTITLTGSLHYASVCAKAFSNVMTASSLDVQGGTTRAFGVGTTLQTTITPNYADELILSHAAWSFSATIAVDSSMVITNQINVVGAQHYGGALAHIIHAGGSISPTWSGWSSSSGIDAGAVSISSFQVAP